MGHRWTQSELWETFTRVETLEFLADIPPEPTWVPCCMKSIDIRDGVVGVELTFLNSPSQKEVQYILPLVYRGNQVKVLGLDQIRNRLRPRKAEKVTQEGSA